MLTLGYVDQVVLPGWFDRDVGTTVEAIGPDHALPQNTLPGPWADVTAPGIGLRPLAVDGGTIGVSDSLLRAPWAVGLADLMREQYRS
jgi:hypothetical protein